MSKAINCLEKIIRGPALLGGTVLIGTGIYLASKVGSLKGYLKPGDEYFGITYPDAIREAYRDRKKLYFPKKPLL